MHLNFEKIPLLGATALILGLTPLCYLCLVGELDIPEVTYEKSTTSAQKKLPCTQFELPLSEILSPLSAKSVISQIAFSLDPPRPSVESDHSRISIRLAQAKQSKRVTLPAKIGLTFTPTQSLEFSQRDDQFWLACHLTAEGQVAASIFLTTPEGILLRKESWTAQPQETPIFSADEIPKMSPFRSLAEARWWGQDLFAEKYSEGVSLQRIEIGAEDAHKKIDLAAQQWLVFQDGEWQPGTPDESLPIAHIVHQSQQGLEIEGWEGASHIRLKIPQAPSIPLKTKGEELFSKLRISSDKQISCVIDKQCLILRTGDWVLKTPKRWKVLRKKEEKEAFLAGNMTGDIFVLDRIDTKNGVKSINGQLFSLKRSQVASIECVQGPKHSSGTLNAKGIGKPR